MKFANTVSFVLSIFFIGVYSWGSGQLLLVPFVYFSGFLVGMIYGMKVEGWIPKISRPHFKDCQQV